MTCAYCGRGGRMTTDHLIKRSQARRSINAARERENPRYKVPACAACNQAVYTRLRVPVSHAHLIPELEALTGGKYDTWDGTPEGLREVVK